MSHWVNEVMASRTIYLLTRSFFVIRFLFISYTPYFCVFHDKNKRNKFHNLFDFVVYNLMRNKCLTILAELIGHWHQTCLSENVDLDEDLGSSPGQHQCHNNFYHLHIRIQFDKPKDRNDSIVIVALIS